MPCRVSRFDREGGCVRGRCLRLWTSPSLLEVVLLANIGETRKVQGTYPILAEVGRADHAIQQLLLPGDDLRIALK